MNEFRCHQVSRTTGAYVSQPVTLFTGILVVSFRLPPNGWNPGLCYLIWDSTRQKLERV